MPKEIYKAIVSRNNDDDNKGRVWVKCAALVGGDVELPIAFRPIFPAAGKGMIFFSVPEVGEEVEIEIRVRDADDERDGEALIDAADGCYRAGELSENFKLPDILKTNYPKRRGMVTKAGHLLMFDDSEGKEELTIQAAFGSAKKTSIRLTKDSITIDNADATLDVNVKKINLLVGADQFAVNGNNLKTYIEGHSHTAGGLSAPPGGGSVTGTSGPPVSGFPGNVLSQDIKLK